MPGHLRVSLGLSQAPEGRGIFPGMNVCTRTWRWAPTTGATRSTQISSGCSRSSPGWPSGASQMGGTLSGGEQQMLAIGRALMARPKLLLLDEPSMGLAPMLVSQIFTIIKEINEQGTTVLLVEQNAVQALSLAHRAYVLELGRVVREAPARDLLDDPAVREAYLGAE